MSLSFKDTFRAIYAWQCQSYLTQVKLKTAMETPMTVQAHSKLPHSKTRYKVLEWDYSMMSNLWIMSSQPGNPLIPCTDEHLDRLLVVIDDAGKRGCSLNDIAFYFSDVDNSEEINWEIMMNADIMVQYLLKYEILGEVTSSKKKIIRYRLPYMHKSGTSSQNPINILLSTVSTDRLPTGCTCETC